jgi:hypothetical protein|tara:strand:+ start:13132 stop:13302 length:171 start_codon:yes stop_codon:yes gene_type:complete
LYFVGTSFSRDAKRLELWHNDGNKRMHALLVKPHQHRKTMVKRMENAALCRQQNQE